MIKWSKKDVIKAFEEAMNPQPATRLGSPEAVLKAIRDRGNGNRGLPVPIRRE